MKRACNSFGIIILASVFLFLGYGSAQAHQDSLDVQPAGKKPKNIIIMIGDGMGFNHVIAASQYQFGSEDGFAWQNFSHKRAMSTHNAEGFYDSWLTWTYFDHCLNNATESAASGTALSTGVSTLRYRVGIDPSGNRLIHLMEVAEKKGKATGIVTSVQVSHATPASFIAHNFTRYDYVNIAREMFASGLDVIMGAGHPHYDENGKFSGQAISHEFVGGSNEWERLKRGEYGTFIDQRSQFKKYMSGKTPERIIGVARVHGTLQQKRSSNHPGGARAEWKPYLTPRLTTVPTLKEMTKAALNVLDDDPDGFVLMVESGAIDKAGHDNQLARMIEEVIEFDNAIKAVLNWVKKNSDWKETLLVVTSDHECGYLTAPYSPASNAPINNGKGNLPGMMWNSTGHTNMLVPIYIEGDAAGRISKKARQNDQVRGKYLHNATVGKILKRLVK